MPQLRQRPSGRSTQLRKPMSASLSLTRSRPRASTATTKSRLSTELGHLQADGGLGEGSGRGKTADTRSPSLDPLAQIQDSYRMLMRCSRPSLLEFFGEES